ncbi:MAG: ABC transporter ATP-binding protein, partial [Holophagales bacterium]|nr:ABC transporter ATP-binding protein [Holophagales bacterium]
VLSSPRLVEPKGITFALPGGGEKTVRSGPTAMPPAPVHAPDDAPRETPRQTIPGRSPGDDGEGALLEARGLTLDLPAPDGDRPTGGGSSRRVRILDGVDLCAYSGTATALVGSSGSGKTWTARAILGLAPEGARLAGEIRLAGLGDLVRMAPEARRRLRGREIAMVFQEPLTAFNPLLRIGTQIAEAYRHCIGTGRREARRQGLELRARVALGDPESAWDAYPHQLSGGQRQRAMLAMALAGRPRLLLADEPTTALDATVQAQILDLLEALGRELDLALLLITHDRGVAARICRHLVVIDAGRTVEAGPLEQVFARPHHPITRGLLGAARASGGLVPAGGGEGAGVEP